MKKIPLILSILATLSATAQKTRKFYDFQWKETDAAHARFYSITESTDSGWHREDYFLKGPSLQMEGVFEDSSCKKQNGKFVYAYPNKILESKGAYAHGKKQGPWITYHPNGAIADSTVYNNGNPVGTSLSWYPNGYPSDSSVYKEDGSGIHAGSFDNGNPSFARLLEAGFKPHGKWKYFHRNGQTSAIEIYDHGVLKDKQYFNDKGEPMTDTTNKDSEPVFRNGIKDWQKYLNSHLYWPKDYEITNTDAVVVVINMTINEEGGVENAYISIPFAPVFDNIALQTIRSSPPWHPAIQHNRKVKYHFRQPVIFRQPG